MSLMAHRRQKVFRMANVKKRGTSSVAALVMARTAQRVAQKNDDQEMLAEVIMCTSGASGPPAACPASPGR